MTSIISLRYVVVVVLMIMASGACLGQDETKEASKPSNPLSRDKDAIASGKIQFNSGCAVCHGPTGQGGRGSRLANVERVRVMRDAQMFSIIKEGVSGTQMPPSSLTEVQIWQLVSFIRSLNAGAIEQDVPGDLSAGEHLFFGGARCSSCHMIRGKGGILGPDLSDIGAERSLEKIRRSLEDPDESVDSGFRHVTAVTADGREISGIAKNVSNYSIQIQDFEGAFHFLQKSDLRELIHHRRSLMPKVTLDAKDFQDILAFLSRQSTESAAERAVRLQHGKEVNP